ncbi:hypothetical protein SYNPS1DRAFT_25336 [Syncephalis pseudoplumigaleata]|uniref:EF-hand domain-containing protein n=1 Tax=Syncephalis pseudoplumigaleata TaxID=1712513 RepID=A0A4P9YSQ6_9FUNG|nr:hypothetical protein SYNPS1DRAFT_25336 [Syncephalis pseudoplumigaleata]|eukprot:RKP22785.1 hypothetical protein SYNPS1DRAFT_25336 [Syncephalis pseudoplumigaleata]
MGNHVSQETHELAEKTHFTENEIELLREEFTGVADDDGYMTREQFKQVVGNFCVCSTATNQFLERLFDAFDQDHDDRVDFQEYINGLSEFSKGTAEEKLALSFKLYDLDRDGYITQEELSRVMTELYAPFCTEDQRQQMQKVVNRIFADLDVDGDNRLSFAEFHLSAMKEPIFDLLSRFLAPPPPVVASLSQNASPAGSPPLQAVSAESLANSGAPSLLPSSVAATASHSGSHVASLTGTLSGANQQGPGSPRMNSGSLRGTVRTSVYDEVLLT